MFQYIEVMKTGSLTVKKLHDDHRSVRTPYTEEELDDLVEGFIVGNGDSAASKELVETHGFEAAKEILRNGFIRNDPNLDDEFIH